MDPLKTVFNVVLSLNPSDLAIFALDGQHEDFSLIQGFIETR